MKKPFYKRTWFLVLAGIVVLGAVFGGDADNPYEEPPKVIVEEKETSKEVEVEEVETEEEKLKREEEEREKKVEEQAAALKAKEEADKIAAAEAEKEKEKRKEETDVNISYEDLARFPDNYIGKSVRFSGKIIQVMEDSTFSTLRIAVNSDYDNIILVTYDHSLVEGRLLEDDNITFYGNSEGIYTYKATSGASISIPFVIAYEITLNN